VPPIKGADQDHVVSVRSIKDTEHVRRIIEERKATKAVCIGGGVMGLEGAWGLKAGGLDVTVLETAPGLLPKQLDDPASAKLEEICNSKGVHIVTGAKISEITEDAVLLEDGTKYEAQLVIMSTGMRPYTKVAEESGIEVDKWVVADTHMRTNVKDVYACGDCCVINGQPQAFWVQAVETGRVAGANAAGEDVEYEAIGSSMVIDAFDTGIFALGSNGKDPDKEFVAVDKSEGDNYEKYYFFEDKLAGVILIGDISKMGVLTQKIAEQTPYSEMF
jgi:NAD(P)H-nitrite reductase large subunit